MPPCWQLSVVVEGLVVDTESPLLIMADTDNRLCVEY